MQSLPPSGSRRSLGNRRIRVAIGLVVLVVLTSLSPLQFAFAATPTIGSGSADPSGLAVVGPRERRGAPIPEPLAKAWSDAYWLAEANPDFFGYPYADPVSGQLVLSPIGMGGDSMANSWISSGAQIRGNGKVISLAAPLVPTRFRDVSYSVRWLEWAKDDATTLQQAGVVDASAIYETEPDFANNRVVITVSRDSAPLFSTLASRYGTTAVAIRIAPNRPYSMPAYGGRENDSSPFIGGAHIRVPAGSCSNGFAWSANLPGDSMISAGHCAPDGGDVWNNALLQKEGTIASGSEENWNTNVGTVYLTGQATYRGDISLIRVSGGYSADPAIYILGHGSSTWSTVKEMWYRSPNINDQFCTGGYNSGALCGWNVSGVGIDHQYADGTWARNVIEGMNPYVQIIGGDSGGPVYTVRPDNGIAAKGVISGQAQFLQEYLVYFTDIWVIYYGFPGLLRTG